MESERNTRLIALVALVAAVGGLALGYSTFTRDLYIKPAADVTLDKDLFKVEFSDTATALASASKITPSVTEESKATGEEATINNSAESGPEITGLSAHFTEPGQKVTYEFYVLNAGSIDAYLTDVIFSKTLGEEESKSNKLCSAAATENKATDDALIKAACNGVTLKVTVEGKNQAKLEATDSSSNTVQNANYKLNKYSEAYDSSKVTVDIEYAEGSTIPDGDFVVQFDSVKLNYSAADPTPKLP